MKKVISIALIAGCMSGLLNASTFDIGISGSDRGINSFSLSIGDYYHVPTQEIIYIERSIPYEEISVIYFLAHHSHHTPRYIMDMRLHGLSWWDISLRLGLNPRILYIVDSRRHSGPPYGRAYGYRNDHRLNDTEIIELVNVQFLSSYHGISVDEVIDRRSSGQRYMNINDDYRMKKDNYIQQQSRDKENQKQQIQQQTRDRENQKQQIQQQTRDRENQKQQIQQQTRDRENQQQQIQQQTRDRENQQQQIQQQTRDRENQKQQIQQQTRDRENQKQQIQQQTRDKENQKQQIQQQSRDKENQKQQIQQQTIDRENQKQQIQQQPERQKSQYEKRKNQDNKQEDENKKRDER